MIGVGGQLNLPIELKHVAQCNKFRCGREAKSSKCIQ